MATIYTSVTAKINTILTAVKTAGKLKAVYGYPVSRFPDGYPAIVFYPDEFQNSFETVSQNFRVIRYKIFVVIGVTQTTLNNIFTTVLPGVVDAVISQFDSDWDMSTIDGNRVWAKIDSGRWGVSEEDKALTAWAELNIEIKLTTNN